MGLKKILTTTDPRNSHWGAELHDRLNGQMSDIQPLRDLRNLVVHGTWAEHGSAHTASPRPWGERDDDEAVYYCVRSKLRKEWVDETALTISDVQHLAVLLRKTWANLIPLYDEMFFPNGYKHNLRPMARWRDND
jgi:hypothetical protein